MQKYLYKYSIKKTYQSIISFELDRYLSSIISYKLLLFISINKGVNINLDNIINYRL